MFIGTFVTQLFLNQSHHITSYTCLVNTEENTHNFSCSVGNGIRIAESANDIGTEVSLKLNFEDIGGLEETQMSTSYIIFFYNKR